jgi:hypothetical protein
MARRSISAFSAATFPLRQHIATEKAIFGLLVSHATHRVLGWIPAAGEVLAELAIDVW